MHVEEFRKCWVYFKWQRNLDIIVKYALWNAYNVYDWNLMNIFEKKNPVILIE